MVLVSARRKGDLTRARLLEISVRRFAADGYRRTAVSDIAREAGVSAAAVYGYFAGKEGLFEAAVDADAAALIEGALAGVGGASGLQLRWPALFDRLVDGLDEHPLARRVLAGHEPEVIERIVALPSIVELRATIARALQSAQEEGRLRADLEPLTLAAGLETIVVSLLISHLRAPTNDAERWAGVLAVLHAALDPLP